MKLLADEDFPPTLISYLQKKRHDVKRVQRSTKGVSDTSVSEKAVKENRIILSFDKDFIKGQKDKKLFNVVVFNFPYTKPADITPYLDNVISEITNLKKRKHSFTAIYSVVGMKLV